MGRREPTWMLERRLENAKKRQQYYNTKNQNDATFKQTRDPRPKMRVGYRSLNERVGTDAARDHARLSILASERAVKWFEGVAATGALAAGNGRLGLEYVDLDNYLEISNFKPSRILATLGGTPTPDRTEWGTRYIRYAKSSAGTDQSSYAAPFSDKVGALTPTVLATAAQVIANVASIKAAVGEYGRMWYELEPTSTTLDTD